jgi:hypothetical protein
MFAGSTNQWDRLKAQAKIVGLVGAQAVDDFAFTVNIVAVVRVRAAEESIARRVVPTVLGAPGTVELRLANEGNAVLAHHATITNVDFSVEEGSITLIETNGVPTPALAPHSAPAPRKKR